MIGKESLYFLAVLPSVEISKEVTKRKEEMLQKFGAKHALKSPPHITLQMPFKWPGNEEIFLKEKLNEFAVSQTPFLVQLEGFGSFPPRVIFVAVKNQESLTARHNALQLFLKNDLSFPEDQLTRRFHPHMTLATRDLKKSVFAEAWKQFRVREYTAEFISSELTLLKHDGHQWQIDRKWNWGNPALEGEK